ncbi:hypothetical protein P171DRAFT_492027 [Karstenula rhodostoma CBS 690.94]|uniref:Uncharacterized protein n=1 Tax=Karstenula rhodostoma CBS 690.94 TaxID=1392251 RepID=A0A9P4P6C7_9PLEO|nr:hypothetical protein P171DRAFT_492027 [Karstenula rhodostoma CBS 690.94]
MAAVQDLRCRRVTYKPGDGTRVRKLTKVLLRLCRHQIHDDCGNDNTVASIPHAADEGLRQVLGDFRTELFERFDISYARGDKKDLIFSQASLTLREFCKNHGSISKELHDFWDEKSSIYSAGLASYALWWTRTGSLNQPHPYPRPATTSRTVQRADRTGL